MAGSALGLLLAGSAAAQGLPAGARACLEALAAAEQSAGDEAAAITAGARCPQFTAALAASDWADNLPAGTIDTLDRAALAALTATAAAYDPPAPPALDTAALAAIVSELEPFVAEPEPTFWERLVEWLDGLLQSDDGEPSWLGELLSSLSLPDALAEILIYVVAILALATVVVILINELRLGGAFLGRSTGDRLRQAAADARRGEEPAVPGFAEIRAMPSVRRRVELLFTLVAARLRQRQRGLLAPGLTHRELALLAAGLDPSARRSLATVAGAAERVTYADWSPDEDDWGSILAEGESLVRRLDDTGAEAG